MLGEIERGRYLGSVVRVAVHRLHVPVDSTPDTGTP